MALRRNIAGFLTPEVRDGKNYPADDGGMVYDISGDTGGGGSSGGDLSPTLPVLTPIDPIPGGDVQMANTPEPPTNTIPVPGSEPVVDWVMVLLAGLVVWNVTTTSTVLPVSKPVELAVSLGVLYMKSKHRQTNALTN